MAVGGARRVDTEGVAVSRGQPQVVLACGLEKLLTLSRCSSELLTLSRCILHGQNFGRKRALFFVLLSLGFLPSHHPENFCILHE